jgi:hypothetical protein
MVQSGTRMVRQTFSIVCANFLGTSRYNDGTCFFRPDHARQRLPSDGFFERDASLLLSALSTHPGVASEKALA